MDASVKPTRRETRLVQVDDQHERAVGESFIATHNGRHRTAFKLIERLDEAPDLLFRDGDRDMRAQVTTAYYDPLKAEFRWTHAQSRPGVPEIGTAFDFERGLVRSINDEIAERCGGERGRGCILLISVHPTVTTATMLSEVLSHVAAPAFNPFEGIYLAGHFSKSKLFGPAEISIKQLA